MDRAYDNRSAGIVLSGNYFAWLLTQKNEPPYPDVATFWRTAVEGHNSINATTDLASQVIDKVICRSSLCQLIGSEIDGGLAGYGLLTSYGIECVFLTVYCAFAILAFLQRSKSSSNPAELPQALPPDASPGPFSRTRYDLLVVAVFLSLGILATIIYSRVTPIVYKYNSSLQLVVSALSFYPLAAMLPLILAWVLCTNNTQVDYYHNEVVYDARPQNHPTQVVIGAAMFTMAAMIWMPPLFGLCLSVAKWLNKVAKTAVTLYAILNFICMWGGWSMLIVFFTGASKDSKDGWSLGQALAITSWMAVLVEFISIICQVGAEAGYSSRLPVEFQVVRKEVALHQQEADGFLNEAGACEGNDEHRDLACLNGLPSFITSSK
ncbi:hypothetical protein BDP55DRAFT_743973 [Colletotrichum godetiae]|uniref:Uncharacterized protein n=1 Tax=Colletotrichum godetiae TaxID=1209918 RepID=A0AAJ0AKV0_9PEZI|nr:uncharacterized protein BDP55DRAFT_743973 [Colletotrichum godetiae]KAK1675754.1 hypothetical protein BDP55DRAFT_743973 [Colletotrichum godetiae]